MKNTPFLRVSLPPLCYKTLPFYGKIYNFHFLMGVGGRGVGDQKVPSKGYHSLIHHSNTHSLMVSLSLYIYSYMSLYMSFSHLCTNPSLLMLPSTPHTFPLPFRLIHHIKQGYLYKLFQEKTIPHTLS